MDKYTCIIIEDEPLALEKMKDFVNKVPFLHLSATFDNALNGLTYLNNNKVDVLFLDINMPRKNGYECLIELKSDSSITDFPVVMYSTSLKGTMADMLFEKGAYYYLRKGDFEDLVKHLQMILPKLSGKNFPKPSREEFLLTDIRVT